MANPFYSPGNQRSENVRKLFGLVAPRYDLMNDLQSFGLHRRWKNHLVNLAKVQPGERALDVCCGTGDLALTLAGRGANVVGLDFSEPMLIVARTKAQKLKSNAAVRFVQGDALNIPFPDAAFDLITVGYGLRNLSSWEAGLAEMARVAAPGARLLVLEFGKPDNALWRTAYFSYLKLFVPLLGLLCCGNAAAYSYILESLKHYPAQRGVEAKMRQLGLAQVRVGNFLGGAMSINVGEIPRRPAAANPP